MPLANLLHWVGPSVCLQHTWTTWCWGQLFRRCLCKLNNYQINLSWETRGKTASDWAKISNTIWVCVFPTLLVFDYYSVAITLNMGDNLVPVKIQQTGVIITFTWQPTWFIPIGNKWAKDIFQRCQYLHFLCRDTHQRRRMWYNCLGMLFSI